MLSETFYFADKPRHRGHDLALWFVSSAFKRDKSREDLLQLIRDTKTVQTGFMVSPVVGLTLMRSVQMNCKDIISCLISEGASVNTWFRGRTMLHEAVKICNYSMLEFLLSIGGINKNKLDVEHRSALMEAALGKPKCLKILLDAACDLTILDEDGNAALHYTMYATRALREDILQCLDLFLAYNVDINMHCGKGKTCLHKAVEIRNCWMIEWLILHNCDLNATLNHTRTICGAGGLNSLRIKNATPLFFAIQKADRILVEVLIACGCEFRQYMEILGLCKPYKMLYYSLRKCLRTVTPLQALCRTVIRRHLSTDILNEVKCIGLPPSLQRFVLCYDELLALNSPSVVID